LVLGLAAVTTGTVLLLTGCGSESNGVADLDADAILEQVATTVDAASSVHVTGEIPGQGAAVTIDLMLTQAGDAIGSVTTDGLTLNLVAVDGTAWYTADEAFWDSRVGPDLASQLGGKYVEIAKGDTTFDAFLDWGTFWDQGVLLPAGKVAKGSETTFVGEPAIELVDSTDGGVLYIATTGETLPLGVDGGKGATVEFTDWNADVTVSAPAPEDVVDPAKLTG
jgi:hypothetical protein